MALYNRLTKADIEAQATTMANETERFMARIKYYADQMATIPAQDMTDLGITADMQANIMSLRGDLAALETWYRANTQFIKRFAQLVVF